MRESGLASSCTPHPSSRHNKGFANLRAKACPSRSLMGQPSTHRSTGNAGRRWTSFTGLYFDEFAPDSAWIRDTGRVQLPPLPGVSRIRLRGEFLPHPEARGRESQLPALAVRVVGGGSGGMAPRAPGTWEILLDLPTDTASRGPELQLNLQ